MSKSRSVLIAGLFVASVASPTLADQLGLGRPALPEEIDAWDVTVLPVGTGLPEGSGDVATGEEVFGENCASCHGDFAKGTKMSFAGLKKPEEREALIIYLSTFGEP